jgi:hypothetical protein
MASTNALLVMLATPTPFSWAAAEQLMFHTGVSVGSLIAPPFFGQSNFSTKKLDMVALPLKVGTLVGGAANGTQPPTARQGTTSAGIQRSKSLTSIFDFRPRPLHMLARLIGHQHACQEHGLAVRMQPFLLPAIDFSTRGKPGDLGGSDTRPPLARGDGVNKRIPGVEATYGRRLLSSKRVKFIGGPRLSFLNRANLDTRYASSSIPMQLSAIPQAAFASRDLKGTPGRVVEVRTGTAQRCGDPPSKIMEVMPSHTRPSRASPCS